MVKRISATCGDAIDLRKPSRALRLSTEGVRVNSTDKNEWSYPCSPADLIGHKNSLTEFKAWHKMPQRKAKWFCQSGLRLVVTRRRRPQCNQESLFNWSNQRGIPSASRGVIKVGVAKEGRGAARDIGASPQRL